MDARGLEVQTDMAMTAIAATAAKPLTGWDMTRRSSFELPSPNGHESGSRHRVAAGGGRRSSGPMARKLVRSLADRRQRPLRRAGTSARGLDRVAIVRDRDSPADPVSAGGSVVSIASWVDSLRWSLEPA